LNLHIKADVNKFKEGHQYDQLQRDFEVEQPWNQQFPDCSELFLFADDSNQRVAKSERERDHMGNGSKYAGQGVI